MNAVDPLVGKYFTREWVLQNVMKMGNEEILDILEATDKEKEKLFPQEVQPAQTDSQQTDETTESDDEPTTEDEPS